MNRTKLKKIKIISTLTLPIVITPTIISCAKVSDVLSNALAEDIELRWKDKPIKPETIKQQIQEYGWLGKNEVINYLESIFSWNKTIGTGKKAVKVELNINNQNYRDQIEEYFKINDDSSISLFMKFSLKKSSKIREYKILSNTQTTIKKLIDSLDLKLNNLTAQEAKSKITSQFILENKDQIFEGSNEISNINDIVSVNAQVSNNILNVAITLKTSTWYDQNGNLGKTEQTFNTVINNFKEPIIKNETTVNSQIQAQEFGWSQIEVGQAKDQINNQFIFDNKTKFLNGDYEINDANQITSVTTSIENNNLKVSFTLSANTWYDNQGNLGTNDKEFSTTIEGFAQPKQETQISNQINANTLSIESNSAQEARNLIDTKFIFDNKTKFFSGDNNILDKDNIIDLKIQVLDNKLNVSFKLKSNSWYDQNGDLGTSDREFTTVIDGFTLKPTELVIKDLDVSNMVVKASSAKGTLGNTILPSEIIEGAGDKTIDWPNNNKAWYVLDYIYQSISELDGTPNIFNNLFTIPTYKDWGWKDFNAIFESYKVISEGNEDATGKLKIELILTSKYGISATQGEKPKFVLTISGLKVKSNPTSIKSSISASSLGLDNLTAQESQSKITKAFILTNKDKFFEGEYDIKNVNDIISVNTQLSNNTLNVAITLKANTWYDQNGNLGADDKEFETIINEFNENLTFEEAVLQSSFSKLKGNGNIFAKTNLLDPNYLAYSGQNGGIQISESNAPNLGPDPSFFRRALDDIFGISSLFTTKNENKTFTSNKINVSENDKFIKLFGKNYQQISQEYNILKDIKEIAFKTQFTYDSFKNYDNQHNRPLFLYKWNISISFTKNDGTTQDVLIYKDKNFRMYCSYNQVDEQRFEPGRLINLSLGRYGQIISLDQLDISKK